MLTLLVAVSAAVGAIPAPAMPSLSACAWSKAPAPVHREFLAAYAKDIGGGMAVLAAHDKDLQAGVTRCLGRSDAPQLWSQGALGSQAIQDGASTELAAKHRIVRADLDAAWLAAPAAARDCTRANASKVFFPTPQGACPDPQASRWFLQRFSIPATDRASATQLLYYFNAKAQSEWANGLLAHLQATPAKPN